MEWDTVAELGGGRGGGEVETGTVAKASVRRTPMGREYASSLSVDDLWWHYASPTAAIFPAVCLVNSVRANPPPCLSLRDGGRRWRRRDIPGLLVPCRRCQRTALFPAGARPPLGHDGRLAAAAAPPPLGPRSDEIRVLHRLGLYVYRLGRLGGWLRWCYEG